MNELSSMTMRANNEEAPARLIATFFLGKKAYGVPTTHVQEIVVFRGVTPVHHAPRFIRGVVNLRGRIVTVFDLALRTGLGARANDTEARAIIVNWSGEQIGLLVNEVIDVFPVESEEIVPVPANLDDDQSLYLLGVLHHQGTLIPILNTDAVLAEDASWVDCKPESNCGDGSWAH